MTAIISLNLQVKDEWSFPFNEVPLKCSYRESDSMLHFNLANTGRGRRDLFPVCVRKTTSNITTQQNYNLGADNAKFFEKSRFLRKIGSVWKF